MRSTIGRSRLLQVPLVDYEERQVDEIQDEAGIIGNDL